MNLTFDSAGAWNYLVICLTEAADEVMKSFYGEISGAGTLQKVLFGVTACVWQCQETGEIRREEILGSDENQLRDILDKVDRAGGALQYIKENGKVYAIMEYIPEQS